PYCSPQVMQVPASSGCWASPTQSSQGLRREPAPREIFDFWPDQIVLPATTLRTSGVVPKEIDARHASPRHEPGTQSFDDLPRASGGVMRFDQKRITQMQLLCTALR